MIETRVKPRYYCYCFYLNRLNFKTYHYICLFCFIVLYRNIESNSSHIKDVESSSQPKKLLSKKKNNPSKHVTGIFNGVRDVDVTIPIDEVGEYLEDKAIPYESRIRCGSLLEV